MFLRVLLLFVLTALCSCYSTAAGSACLVESGYDGPTTTAFVEDDIIAIHAAELLGPNEEVRIRDEWGLDNLSQGTWLHRGVRRVEVSPGEWRFEVVYERTEHLGSVKRRYWATGTIRKTVESNHEYAIGYSIPTHSVLSLRISEGTAKKSP